MRRAKVTEAELVDVVIGGNVEKRLEERVHQAARTDLKTAAQFAQWSDVTAVVCREMDAPRQTARRLSIRVMERIGELKAEPEKQEYIYPDEVVDEWNAMGRGLGSWNVGRLRGKPAIAVAAAMLALAVGIAVLALNHRYAHTFVVEYAAGEIAVLDSGGTAVEVPLRTGERHAFPLRLRLAEVAEASIHFPHGTAVRLSASADVLLIDSRRVRQFVGTAAYRIPVQGGGLNDFTVYVPQGSIVDLGTDFEVVVADDERAVVRVESGQVRVTPRDGSADVAGARQLVVLTPQKAVTEDIKAPEADPAKVPAAAAGTPPDHVEAVFRPQRNVLQADTPLTVFVRPQPVAMPVLTPGSQAASKAPPFTSSAPRAGIIRTRVNEQPAEVAVACDTKLNGEVWIYVDANMNGDLTDDPHFQEGADFVAGEAFAAGLAEHSDSLWLLRPIRVNTAASPPSASVVEDRLDCINRAYLEGELELPDSGAGPAGLRQRFLLLDTDSDGDYGDLDGSLGVWVSGSKPGETMQVLNVAPPGRPTTHMGYRWTLSRNLSGDFVMSGERVQKPDRTPLRVGAAFPELEVTTTSGQRMTIEPPAKGYLLVYAWSTWYSACQRDVPYDFNDLHTKFGPRGLAMVGISTDFREEDLLDYVSRNQISYPQIYNGPDLSAGPLAELGIDRSPLAILVDATGTVVSVGDGAADIWSFLDNNLPQ